MRSVTSLIPAVALLLLAAVATASLHASSGADADSAAPWKIVEDWKVKLPAAGMQIMPVFTSVRGMYVATCNDGHVVGVNTTSRGIQWTAQYNDIGFVSALPSMNSVFVARYSGTTVLDADTGAVKWHSTNVTMQPNLAEPNNALVFGSTIVYRDATMGWDRLCAVDGASGTKLWCDNRRVFGTPDAALNGTFTAVFYDVNSSSYVANMDAQTGAENWIAYAPRVFTGSEKWVGLRDGPFLRIVSSMDGLAVASIDVSNVDAIANAVFIDDSFYFTDGNFWLAGVDCNSGAYLFNISAPRVNPNRRVELQKDTPGLLVVALLSDIHTNFTRINKVTGTNMWTVTGRPTGMSLAPMHAWLGTDILYVRKVDQKWGAYGAQTGAEIGSGSGDLFLPRSVAESVDRPHFSFYVTTNAGEMVNLRVERK